MDELLDLLKKYRETRDDKFLDEILRIVGPKIFLFLLPRGKSVAEDLRQEVLIGISAGLEEFKAESTAKFWAWCYKIARNRLNDYLRKNPDRTVSLDHETLIQLIDASATEKSIDENERKDLEEALLYLRNSDAACFALLWKLFVLGMDYQEIATDVGSSYDAVRVRIRRCVESARKIIKD